MIDVEKYLISSKIENFSNNLKLFRVYTQSQLDSLPLITPRLGRTHKFIGFLLVLNPPPPSVVVCTSQNYHFFDVLAPNPFYKRLRLKSFFLF